MKIYMKNNPLIIEWTWKIDFTCDTTSHWKTWLPRGGGRYSCEGKHLFLDYFFHNSIDGWYTVECVDVMMTHRTRTLNSVSRALAAKLTQPIEQLDCVQWHALSVPLDPITVFAFVIISLLDCSKEEPTETETWSIPAIQAECSSLCLGWGINK